MRACGWEHTGESVQVREQSRRPAAGWGGAELVGQTVADHAAGVTFRFLPSSYPSSTPPGLQVIITSFLGAFAAAKGLRTIHV